MPRKTKIKIYQVPNGGNAYFIQIGKRAGVYLTPDSDEETAFQILNYEPRFHKDLGWILKAEN